MQCDGVEIDHIWFIFISYVYVCPFHIILVLVKISPLLHPFVTTSRIVKCSISTGVHPSGISSLDWIRHVFLRLCGSVYDAGLFIVSLLIFAHNRWVCLIVCQFSSHLLFTVSYYFFVIHISLESLCSSAYFYDSFIKIGVPVFNL